MSRPLRPEFPHARYHLTSRGDRREPIFVDGVDRAEWLAVFDQVCTRFNWRCHAWCLMGNHYHVLIETPEPNLSASGCQDAPAQRCVHAALQSPAWRPMGCLRSLADGAVVQWPSTSISCEQALACPRLVSPCVPRSSWARTGLCNACRR